MHLPKLSVVMAFKENEHSVLDALASIYSMDYPHEQLEVLVIDDWHDDILAAEITSKYPAARLVRGELRAGCDASKELGIATATGDIIAHTDADCTVAPLWGQAIAKCIANGADAVTGPVRHPKTLLRELICISDFPDFQGNREMNIRNFPGCNFAITREVADSLGRIYNRTGDLHAGSDRLLSWRISKSHRIIYSPSVLVTHTPPVDMRSLLTRRRLYGRTALILRGLDDTLPGGRLAQVGLLAAPAYLAYKCTVDVLRLAKFAVCSVVNPWHTPPLACCLLLFRLLDCAGIIALQSKRSRA